MPINRPRRPCILPIGHDDSWAVEIQEMADSEHRDAPDDFVAEVSDLGSAEPERLAPFLAAAHLPRRQRVLRLAVIIAMPLLALLVVLGGNPALRVGLGTMITGLAPSVSTPTTTPGDNLFYLLPNPPGVDVLLDGHLLARPPWPGDPHPLRLTPGRHAFAWRSRLLPFGRLSCFTFVPPSTADTCPLVPSSLLPPELAGRPGFIIGMHETLDMLNPNDAQQLSDAI